MEFARPEGTCPTLPAEDGVDDGRVIKGGNNFDCVLHLHADSAAIITFFRGVNAILGNLSKISIKAQLGGIISVSSAPLHYTRPKKPPPREVNRFQEFVVFSSGPPQSCEKPIIIGIIERSQPHAA